MMIRSLTDSNVVTEPEAIGKDEIGRVEDTKEQVTSRYVKFVHQ